MTWITSPTGAAYIGIAGLVIGVLGFYLTVWGLRLTYLQAVDAKQAADSATNAAEAAQAAVGDFRFKLDRYSAYRDISEAEFAMDACRSHLETANWRSASISYELARRALVRVQQADVLRNDGVTGQIQQITNHIQSFCTRVDAALASKGQYPNASKVTSTIRLNYDTLSAIKILIEKDLA